MEGVQLNEAAWAFVRERLSSEAQVAKLAGDASFRHYYRVFHNGQAYVLMDAPPEREDSGPFLDVARFLECHGVGAPRVFAADVARGHALLEDFGDTTFLTALGTGVPAETLYAAAIETLLDLQATPIDGSCLAHRRHFDRVLLRAELGLFTTWYLPGILGQEVSEADSLRFDALFHRLLDDILTQPIVLVHRDYHSRNLMWRDGRVGVLDFQDALMGPITYDLASLLRDCYVAWGEPFREWAMRRWLAGAEERLGYAPGWERFKRAFDWMALQRNLKAIGIFGRLSLRDGKHGYLGDIPRTFTYVRETLAAYPELDGLRGLIDQYAPPALTDAPRGG